jgi:hypothetical protein
MAWATLTRHGERSEVIQPLARSRDFSGDSREFRIASSLRSSQ